MPTTITPIPSGVRYIGLAKETTRGTPVAAPTGFIYVTSLTSPNEMPHYADVKPLTGSAVTLVDTVATQTWAEPSYSGDVYSDTFGYWLQMLMGEVSTTGSTPSTATTLNGAVVAGASTAIVASAAGLVAGDNVQIGTGSLAEVKTILSIASNTLTFNTGQTLLFGHASGAAVVKVVAPFIHVFSGYNTPNFQPPSYTIFDYRGTTVATVAQIQQLPGALVADLSIKGTATGLVQYTVKLAAFKSSLVPKMVPSYSGEDVKPAWQGVTSIAGSSTLLLEDFSFDIKRTAAAVPTINGTQDPASIFASGDLAGSGDVRLIATGDDTEYNKMVANSTSALDINFTSGTGSTLRAVQIHASKTKYDAIGVEDKSFISYSHKFKALPNTTDIGNSGGIGIARVTLTNAIPTY